MSNRETALDDFLSFSTWFWFLHVPGDSCNVLESIKVLELAWNIENSFQVFLNFFQYGYGFFCSKFTYAWLGLACVLIGEWNYIKSCTKNPWNDDGIFDWKSNIFESFWLKKLANFGDFDILDWYTKLPAFLGYSCFTKRLKNQIFVFPYNLN